MFNRSDEQGYVKVIDKITRKTLVYGERTLLSEFRLERGAALPVHNHPYEQTGYLVSGRIDLKIEDKNYKVNPGDSWCIPGNVDHGAVIIEDSVAIEVFSPIREDYLP